MQLNRQDFSVHGCVSSLRKHSCKIMALSPSFSWHSPDLECFTCCPKSSFLFNASPSHYFLLILSMVHHFPTISNQSSPFASPNSPRLVHLERLQQRQGLPRKASQIPQHRNGRLRRAAEASQGHQALKACPAGVRTSCNLYIENDFSNVIGENLAITSPNFLVPD